MSFSNQKKTIGKQVTSITLSGDSHFTKETSTYNEVENQNVNVKNEETLNASPPNLNHTDSEVIQAIAIKNQLDDSFLIEQLLLLNKLKDVRRKQNTALKHLTRAIRDLDDFDSDARKMLYKHHQSKMELNKEFITRLGLGSVMRTVQELHLAGANANKSSNVVESESGIFGRNSPAELMDRLERIARSFTDTMPDATERNGFMNFINTMFKEGGFTKAVVNDVADSLYEKVFSEKNKNTILLLSVLTITTYVTLNRNVNSFALLIIMTGLFAYAYTGANKTEIMATLALFDTVNCGILGYNLYKQDQAFKAMAKKAEVDRTFISDTLYDQSKLLSRATSRLFKDDDTVQAESGIGIGGMDMIGPINLLFSAATVAFTGKNVPSDIYNKVLNFDRNSNSLTSIYNVILNTVNTVMKYFRDQLNCKIPDLLKYGKMEVDDILERIDGILLKEAKGTYLRTHENYFELEAVIIDLKKILMATERTNKNSNLILIMHKELNKLERLSKEFAAANIDCQGSKQEAVFVLFRGGPGCGKSIAMEHLAFAVIPQCLNTKEEFEEFKKDPYSRIYNRQHENKYHDGYKTSMIVMFFDDLFQAKDIAGNPDSEAMNIIRIANGFQCIMHTANMEEKGRLTCQSHFGICSTNEKTIEVQSIKSMPALLRRFTLDLIATVKLKYCDDNALKVHKSMDKRGNITLNGGPDDVWNRKIDPSKLDKDSSGNTLMGPYMLEFYRNDNQGNVIGEPMDFEMVVEETMAAYRDRKVWAKQHRKEFLKTAEKYFSPVEDFCPQEINSATEDVQMEPFWDAHSSINEAHLSTADHYYPGNEDDMIVAVAAESGSRMVITKELREKYCKTLHKRFWMNNSGLSYSSGMFKNHDMVRDTIIYAIESKYDYYPWWEKRVIYKQLYKGFLKTDKEERELYCFADHVRKLAKRAIYTRVCPTLKLGMETLLCELDDAMHSIPMYHTVTEYFRNLSTVTKVMGGIVAVVAAIFAGKGIYDAVNKWMHKDDLEPESHGFGHKAPKEKVKTSATIKAMRAMRAQAESGDSNGLNIIKSLIKKHVWTLYFHPEGKVPFKFGHMTGVYGDQYLLNFHFAKEIAAWVIKHPDDRTSYINFVRDNGNAIPYRIHDLYNRFSFDNLQYVDACLLSMPKGFPRSSDNRKYFASEKDHNGSMLNQEFVLYTNRGGNTTLLTGYAKLRTTPVNVVSDIIEEYVVPTSYEYRGGLTEKGDCGGPLFLLNPKIPTRKIFGFHFASHKQHGIGYSNILTIEMIEKDLHLENQIISEEIDLPFDESITSESGMVYEGFVQAAPYNTKCNIIRSRLFDKVIKSKQAIVFTNNFTHDGKVIDPMKEALKRYCLPRAPISEASITKAAKSYFSYMEENTIFHIKREVLDFDTAVNGYSDNPYLGSITSGTSAGYPHVLDASTNSKKLYYADPELNSTTLRIKILDYRTKIEKGIRPLFVFQDQLKLERLPIEKIFKKTRMFSGVDWEYLILIRIYFGAFMAHCTANNISIGMSAGINAFGDDWDALARKLTQFDNYHDPDSTNAGAGDYKSYDGSLNSIILEWIGYFINTWYGKPLDHPDSIARAVLWQEVFNSRHVTKHHLFTWLGSLPSGHPLTFIINCIYNQIAMRFCFFKRVKNVLFDSAVYVITGGDDNSFTVKKEFHEFFNELTLAEDMPDLGLTYTTELKGTATKKFRKITEIEFLKRRFLYDKSVRRFIAPLNTNTVLEIPMWTKSENPAGIAVNNIVESLNELSLWSDHWDDAEHYYTKITKLYRDYYDGIQASTPIFIDIEDRKEIVLNRGTHIII